MAVVAVADADMVSKANFVCKENNRMSESCNQDCSSCGKDCSDRKEERIDFWLNA